MLYVSANSTGKCMEANANTNDGQLLAFATHCQQEAVLDRQVNHLIKSVLVF